MTSELASIKFYDFQTHYQNGDGEKTESVKKNN